MKNSNKKGFTIVELVIVIAVIAILAAVLIPTISSLIKKANLSNDQSMIRNMNTTLAMEVVPNSKFDYAGDAIAALNANGFTGKYTPYSSGFDYAYHLESNTMYLVDDNNNVIYPDNKVSVSDLWFLWSNNAVDKVEGATKYVALVSIEGESYYDEHFAGDTEYTIDLADHYINTAKLDNVTVINGVLISGANGSNADGVTEMVQGDKSTITGATATDGVKVIKNTVFNEPNILAGTANTTFENCYFYGTNTSGMTINNITFEGCTFVDATSYIFNVQGSPAENSPSYKGTLTVNDCTFINCARIFNLPLYVLGESTPGSVVITNNTFYGVTGENRSVIQLSSQTIYNTTSTEKGYINITVSNNTFEEISSTQAGIITLHTNLTSISGLSADNITISNNTVSSDIPADKYVVNDDGKADNAFTPYNITEFKTALNNKFVSSKK